MKPAMARYPAHRARRLRRSPGIRRLVREADLSPSDLIWPIFVRDGRGIKEPVISLPGVERVSPDIAVQRAKMAFDLNIAAIAIFPYTESSVKSESCEEAWNPENLANRTVRLVKDAVPSIPVMLDVALDPYNSLGHDGIVRSGEILNDETLDCLVLQALEHARAGADILGPSDMMDGRIAAIRNALEANNFKDLAILSYSAKYASCFYGPFRDAVGSSGALIGDKKTYQMDPGNSDEALRMVRRDLDEGADMVMVKPGLPYLDICRRVKDRFAVPTYAYQVSGEYAMISAAAERGWIDKDQAILESLLAFKRAGCDGILTYFAPAAAKLIQALPS